MLIEWEERIWEMVLLFFYYDWGANKWKERVFRVFFLVFIFIDWETYKERKTEFSCSVFLPPTETHKERKREWFFSIKGGVNCEKRKRELVAEKEKRKRRVSAAFGHVGESSEICFLSCFFFFVFLREREHSARRVSAKHIKKGRRRLKCENKLRCAF
jgi:hypothetical protein